MRGLSSFILARTTSAGITLLGVTLIVFTAIHLIPGRFEEILVPRGTPEFRHALAVRLGLDLPLPRQYLHWLGRLLAGDLGASLITSQPISSEFAGRIPVTLELATLAVLTAVVAGAPLGLLAGLAGGTRITATLSRLFCGLTMSVPDFVLGSLFLYLFSKYALGLTVGQYVPFSTDPVGHLRCIVLPVLTLGMVGIGTVAAVTREAIVAIADQDYVFAAAARGRRMRHIVQRHMLRNAGVPVLTVVAIYLGYLLGGSILVEQLFSMPGVGRYIFQAVQSRDYPVVQAGVLMVAAAFVVTNMLTDIAYGLLDPRLRSAGGP